MAKLHPKRSTKVIDEQVLRHTLDHLCEEYYHRATQETPFRGNLKEIIEEKAEDYFKLTGKNYVYHETVKFTNHRERPKHIPRYKND